MTPDGKIVISVAAGHGGINRGAVSRCGLLVEAEYVLRVCDLAAELMAGSALVKLVRVRTEAINLSNAEEAAWAWREGSDYAVSCHVNSYPDPSISGTLALHRPGCGRSRRLALALLDEFRPRDTRCALADSRYPGAVAVLAPYRMPATVLELGYASCDADVRWLLAPETPKLIAGKIARALEAFAAEPQPQES